MKNIDITEIVKTICPRDYSASVAEIGPHAGRDTFAAAKEDALELFGDQYDRAEFTYHIREFSAWSDEEIEAWSDEEVAAIILQFISGDMRECEFAGWPEPFTSEWWPLYMAACNEGTLAWRFGGYENTVWYYLGS